MMKTKEPTAQASGKRWLKIVKQSVETIGHVAGTLLAAPVNLPAKIIRVAQYLALLAGIVKATEKSIDHE